MVNFLIYFGLLFATFSSFSSAKSPLKFGFYYKSCPSAEAIVKNVVHNAYAKDAGVAAALIRLHFHDCFVRGCDASILIDSTPNNKAEKDSMGNKGVAGFDVINEAKTVLEASCPNTVSCADIVAFAARDSVQKAGGLHYSVPAGRRDGRVSLISEVTSNLPDAFFDAKQLKNNFAKKGLSLDDMVTLSGAHSIGDSHCSSFSQRLYSFNATYSQDPTLNHAYANQLRGQCPKPSGIVPGGPSDPIVHFDPATPFLLDNNYYNNLKSKKGLLASDQALWSSAFTRSLVKNNANHPGTWAKKFAAAMVRMGSIEVLTGTKGEIRKKCSVVN